MRFFDHDFAPFIAGIIAFLTIIFAANCAAHKAPHKLTHSMEGIVVSEAYMRVNGPNAKSAAAYLYITNHGPKDTLISVRSEIANRTELHTHIINAEGVARMVEIEGGLELAEQSMTLMKRGGEHVMFMGLRESLNQGDIVPLTLVFENADDIQIDVPVDNDRKPKAGKHNH